MTVHQLFPKTFEKSILIVDDAKNLYPNFSAVLGDYQLYFASTIKKALKILNSRHIDAVLLDLGLPAGIEGYEVLNYVKNNPVLRDIPVIVLTVLDNPKEVRNAIVKWGAQDYLFKDGSFIENAKTVLSGFLFP